MPPFRIARDGDRLVCLCADGRRFAIAPSSADRRAPRWWRCLDTAGRAMTPWAATPRIAAALAAGSDQGSEPPPEGALG